MKFCGGSCSLAVAQPRDGGVLTVKINCYIARYMYDESKEQRNYKKKRGDKKVIRVISKCLGNDLSMERKLNMP